MSMPVSHQAVQPSIRQSLVAIPGYSDSNEIQVCSFLDSLIPTNLLIDLCISSWVHTRSQTAKRSPRTGRLEIPSDRKPLATMIASRIEICCELSRGDNEVYHCIESEGRSQRHMGWPASYSKMLGNVVLPNVQYVRQRNQVLPETRRGKQSSRQRLFWLRTSRTAQSVAVLLLAVSERIHLGSYRRA